MATISAGNGGMDPWKLLSEYVRNQQRSTALNMRGEELERNRNFTRERLDRAPTDAYNRQLAVGQANIENAQAAIAAGLDPGTASGRGGRGSGRGSGVVNTRAAAEFAKGLGDGGITNPIALSVLMGNSQIESAGFNPTITGDKGTAYGHMQWRLDRQDRLRQFARSMGRHESDSYAQGKFAAWELTQGTERAAGQRLLNARTLEEAQLGANSYLRMKDYDKGAGAMHYSHRLAASRDWAGKITGDKSFTQTTKANAAPNVLADEEGNEYSYVYPSLTYVASLREMGPGYEELAQRYKPDPLGPVNNKGQVPFRYYNGKKRPVTPGTEPTTVAAPTGTGDGSMAVETSKGTTVIPAEPVTTGAITPKPALAPTEELEEFEPDEDTEDEDF
jgi:hypothetical protein